MRALELSPSFAYAYNELTGIYYTQARYEDALAAARKAAELDPESNRYQMRVSTALLDLGRSEAAIRAIREAIDRNTDIPGNYNFIARQLGQMGRSGEALYWEKRAWDLDPSSPNRRLGYCQGLLQVWAVEEETRCIGEYREEYPDDGEANNYYAHLTRDAELGLANGYAQVEANPNFWYRKMQLVEWLVLEERPEEALQLMSGTFPDPPVVQPLTIWAAQSVVYAHLQLGQTEQANALIEAALDHIDSQRKLQGTGLSSGIDDVTFLVQRGDIPQAVIRIEEAIDRDWQFFSWGLIVNPLTSRGPAGRTGLQGPGRPTRRHHGRRVGLVPGQQGPGIATLARIIHE